MKLKTTLLIMAASLPAWVHAQWTALNSGTTKELKTVYFRDNNTGWIAGKDGLLRKTTDGGSSWSTQTTGTTKDINSVFFISAQTGWLTGKDGVIKKTTDGGTTWTSQASGTGKKLYSIHFTDDQNGIAVGEEGVVLTTRNGGTTWSLHSTGLRPASSGDDDEGYRDLYGAQMLNAQTVYACGKKGLFIKSADGGVTWASQNPGTTADLNALHFPVSNKGYVCYQAGGVRHTSGSGSFTSVTANTSKDLNGVYFVAENKGWVVGNEGRILFTPDGGSTWRTQNLSTVTKDLKAVYFPSAATGYAVGKDGTLLKSNGYEGGTTAVTDPENAVNWQLYPNPVRETLHLSVSGAPGANTATAGIRIIDLNGKVILNTPSISVQSWSCNTSDWLPGIYFLQITEGNQARTISFVKQ